MPLRHSSAFFSLDRACARGLQRFAVLHQALGRVGTAVQQHVLDQHLQLRLDLLIHLEHAGIHDAHVHARRDGVIKKRGVHGLANLVVAAKAERDVRDAAADLRVRQVGLDPARGVDEVDRVVVVLLHAGGNGEDVRIEDDVFGRKADLVDQNPVGALADADLVLVSRGLALFVEGHHHHRRAIFQHRSGVLAKLLFAFFQRNRVDDALALQALQPGLDDLPFRGVHHEGHLGDFGLARQQLQEARHRGDAVDHALVHADVEDVGAVLDLLPGHAYRFFVFAFLDQLGELGRTGHIGPLADHDVDAGLLGERLRSRQTKRLRLRGVRHRLALSRTLGCSIGRRPQLPRRLAFERFGDRRDVLGRVAAAAAGNIDQPSSRKVAQITGHVLRAQIEPGRRKRIRQTGIRIARDRHVRLLRELLQERIHQIGTERAVEPHRQRLHVLHRVPERLGGLRGDHRLAAAPHRRRDHHRQFLAVLIEHLADGDQRRLGVQRVEDRLDQKQVRRRRR